ncbi:DUF982 domain-containing protein [Rhizobium sp. 3T7]|uniref:DUF982 domain-containing protein n=1 Tax=Rhizobium sp. 3T7 TaxID=2874922 RepID=UPI001CCEE661|nr:DUF982 domain-containing protein [Rhizobium sp. 3T7]MBZ9792045.1 DUF982 domain-containing protein [Rhizobium sp. 3T7]
MPTPDILWNTPINVRLQNGTEKSFQSIHDTLDFLETEWPKAYGAYHDAAVASCRNALRRQTPPAVSKELFLAACLEAGFAVRGGNRRASGQRLSETAHRHF